MIGVTKAFLPPMEEYVAKLESIWQKNYLTNRGPLVLELEQKLMHHLGTTNILIMANGTLPLQIAVNMLGNGGEIITTPFSYVATTAAILWEKCKPVFVDIDPEHLTIDECAIEEKITPQTKAILATHVFGNACNVEVIEEVAKRHNIQVIYDAAHCFAVKYKGKSIFSYGDVSTCSFHATKLFHTGEGGAVFCSNEKLAERIYYGHNFGHRNLLEFYGLGINAKISELQAAMGLTMLPHMAHILSERQNVTEYYDSNVSAQLRRLKLRTGLEWNYSYYPVIFKTEEQLLKVEKALNDQEIVPRRYFYPSLNTLDFVKGAAMPVSEEISKTILCLPLFTGMDKSDLKLICSIINSNL